MNQMMSYATGWMSAGMEMRPLVWVLTLALLGVWIRKNVKLVRLPTSPTKKSSRLRRLR